MKLCKAYDVVGQKRDWQLKQLSALMTLVLAAGFGCDDPVSPIILDQMVVQADLTPTIMPDMSPLPIPDMEMEAVDMSPIIPPMPPPIGWIELNLSPPRSYYTLTDQAELTVEVYDVYGERQENAPITYTFSFSLGTVSNAEGEISLGINTLDRQVTLSFNEEGSSDIIVCSTQSVDQPVCASRPILVDDSGPIIEVTWPPRGIALSSADPWPQWSEVYPEDSVPDTLFGGEFDELPSTLSEVMPVFGRVDRLGSDGTLLVNGVLVMTDANGFFTTTVPTQSGYLELMVIADDGIRFTPSIDRRWILFASDYLPHNEQGSSIPSGLELGVNQSFIDHDNPSISGPPYQVTEVAQLIDLFLSLIEPARLIAQPTLINSPELTLTFSDLVLGPPNIDLQITDSGLSLFVDLNRVQIEVSGRLEVGSISFDLSGYMIVGVSAFADYELSTGDDPLHVQYLNGGVAVTHITPQLNEEAANTIISVLDSTARGLIVEQIESQMLVLVRRDLPRLLETAIGDVYRGIRSLPIQLNSGFEGSPNVDLQMLITPTSVSSSPLRSTTLTADVYVDNSTETFAHNDSRGVPRLTNQSYFIEETSPVIFRVRPEIVNAILVEVWRTGLLDLSPPLPASAALFYSQIKAIALSPPILTIGRSNEPYPLYLELGALRLELTQTASGMNDIYEIYIRVGGSLLVDGGTFTVELEDTPKVEVTLVELGNDRPAVTERLIASLFSDQIWPSLSDSLISSLVLGIPDSPLYLDELSYLGIELEDGWLRPQFNNSLNYQEDWITMNGVLLFDFP
jgi:hypothetical protein